MDTFSGYNQIYMVPENEEKMALVTDHVFFCYRMMPFGLKNVGAIYQWLVNKVFKDQIGHNIEVYMNDMLVKHHALGNHVDNLEESFIILHRCHIKLNPTKCTFGMMLEKFLKFMVL